VADALNFARFQPGTQAPSLENRAMKFSKGLISSSVSTCRWRPICQLLWI